MFRRLFAIIISALFFTTGYAQQILKATVYENKTRIALPDIRVRNLNNKQAAITGKDGKFSIIAKLNDLLVLTSFTYENDTVVVTNLKEREIFMEPKGTLLKEVKVLTPQTQLGTLTVPELHNQTVTYQKDAAGNYKGGIAFNIFSNNSEENKRKKLEQIAHDDQVQKDIDNAFSTQTLSKYLPLKPSEIEGFKIMYRPSVKTFTSKQFNLLYYIDSCYKEYQKLPPEKRVVQKLDNNSTNNN